MEEHGNVAEETISYRGVTITVIPGNPERKQQGRFLLSWPGHDPEKVESTRHLAPYVLEEAREFVDTWIEQGYIQIDEEGGSTTP
jgi:hypothetical protein